MSKKLSTKEFIEKAKLIHGDKYDYSLVEYVNNYTKIKIICKEHDIFEQTPDSHLNNGGCKKCGVKKRANKLKHTTKQFIIDAKKIHGDKYDYSLVEYVGNRIKVKIICSIHDVFTQEPKSHLKGDGCKRCACMKVNDNIRTTSTYFIKRSNEIHKNKYDYSLIGNFDSINYNTKIKIICPIHDVFEQTIGGHLNGCGCILCRNDNSRLGKDKFISKANNIHKNKYDYSLVEYINNKTKIKIICPIHDVFEQRPDRHLFGCGCNKCSQNGAFNIFRNKKLYILYDYTENLHKIGISQNIKNRIKYLRKKIKHEIVCIREYDNGSAILEKQIHNMFLNKRKIHPTIHGGYTEWFLLSIYDINKIDTLINK